MWGDRGLYLCDGGGSGDNWCAFVVIYLCGKEDDSCTYVVEKDDWCACDNRWIMMTGVLVCWDGD